MRSAIITVGLMVLGQGAQADVWQGTGKVFGPDRQELAGYSVEVERENLGSGESSSLVTVSVDNGQTFSFGCRNLESGFAWETTCDDGQVGGGYYFENGLATQYTTMPDGRSYATQIVMDSDDTMRILRTELRGDEVLKFYVESYTRTNTAAVETK